MENNTTEDEYADSGADTAGSDYSKMSSSSSDLSLGDLQDPFLVSIHIITDPGRAKSLQRAADQVLSWLHPELTLFRVSERASSLSRHSKLWSKRPKDVPLFQPALAVILFLQVDYNGKDSLENFHIPLRRPPWHFHHTERVNGHGLLPFSHASQDFFTLAPGTPLWALRQVHYGKEVVRFTVYCQHETYVKQVRLYRLLLHRRLAQRKEDFCFCVVYSNHDMEIQLSFKQLPRGQSPTPTECAIMEIRVRDVGRLVPMLPHPCTPISDIRWQTEDYDGNRILLQAQGSCKQQQAQFPHVPPDSSSAPLLPSSSSHNRCPPPFGRGPTSYRNRRHRSSSRSNAPNSASSCLHLSQTSLPLVCEQEDPESPKAVRGGWMGLRTRSLFSLQTEGSTSPSHDLSSATRPRSWSLAGSPMYRINVDTLVGAEETDVDTGQAVSSSCIDLSVVSAYTRSQPQRPLSAPPQDAASDLAQKNENNYSSLRRTPEVPRTKNTSSKDTPNTTSDLPFPKSRGTQAKQTHAAHQGGSREDGPKEDEQEFYI